MGNATKHSPTRVSSPARNVQSNINRIKNRLAQLKKNATSLRNMHKRMGNRIRSDSFYESDMIKIEQMEARARELMREKKMLDRMHSNLVRYQLTHGFPHN